MSKFQFLAVALLGLIPASVLHAESISTGVADWKLVGVTDLSGSTTPASVPGEISIGSTAVVVPVPNPGWTSTASFASTDAKWISASTDGATNGIWGWYTYELDLTVSAGTVISGFYSSDNMVDSFTIGGTQFVTTTPVGDIEGYKYTYSFVAPVSGSIAIIARIYNESTSVPTSGGTPGVTYPVGTSDPNGIVNPTGFILAGTTAIPLPSSVWAGGVLCGILAGINLRKRYRTIS